MKIPFLFLCLISVLLLSRTAMVTAVTCNPVELLPCSGAILGSGAPSPACCAKLKEQQPCFCQYMKDPNLKNFVSSPNSKKVAAACKVAYPSC